MTQDVNRFSVVFCLFELLVQPVQMFVWVVEVQGEPEIEVIAIVCVD